MGADLHITVQRAKQPADAVPLIEEYSNEYAIVKRDSYNDIVDYVTGEGSGVWIAYAGAEAVGCIALRPLPVYADSGEVKRLYVRQQWRGKAIASALLLALETFAREYGYRSLYLDTKDDFAAAIAFYQRYGYEDCDRYNDNPQATIFMKKSLTPTKTDSDSGTEAYGVPHPATPGQ